MPESIALSTYYCSLCPVTATMSGCTIPYIYKYSLILSVASYPSIIGMLQSMNIKSKLHLSPLFSSTSFFTISNASYPLNAFMHTDSTSIFTEYFNNIRIAWMLKPMSSTISIFYCFYCSIISKEIL